jgi:N-acetylneuraminic acid mutarotase
MRKARVGLGLVGLLAALTVTFTSCANVETPGASPSPSVSVSPAPSPTPSSTPPATPATWRRIASLPLGHWAEAAVWDGREVLVFGRKQLWTEPYCRYVAFAYSPSNDTWRRLPGAPGPAGCLEGGDRVVWTGTEALLWGVTNTSYNPETNTWRKLPRPPAGFGGPSVIAWTGTQMIGWGGGCCGGAESTGAVYTPATNSWRRLPRSPLSARHTTAVWTGTELIIAGGEGPDLEMSPIYDDAAAYDPATRTWRDRSDANASLRQHGVVGRDRGVLRRWSPADGTRLDLWADPTRCGIRPRDRPMASHRADGGASPARGERLDGPGALGMGRDR